MELEANYVDYLLHGSEERNLEYKASLNFSTERTKAVIARAIAAHTNIRDGGMIVVGLDEKGESYIRSGVTAEHLSTLKVDELRDYIRAHLTPTPEFSVQIGEYDGKSFIVFSVSPFRRYPSVCIKSFRDEGAKKYILVQGAFYVRSRRKPESVAVETLEDLEDLVDMAADQWIQYRAQRDVATGHGSEADSQRRFAAEGTDL